MIRLSEDDPEVNPRVSFASSVQLSRNTWMLCLLLGKTEGSCLRAALGPRPALWVKPESCGGAVAVYQDLWVWVLGQNSRKYVSATEYLSRPKRG